MTLTEIRKNLFENLDDTVMYAHCIAQDDCYGAGIAPKFVKEFGIKQKLSEALEQSRVDGKKGNEGFCVIIKNAANLITKNHTGGKPTYESLQSALIDLKNQMVFLGYKKLYMPRIACGLDGLCWPKVKFMINTVFSDMSIDIVIKNI